MLRRLAVLAFLSAAPALASAQTITIAESNDQDQTINIAECNNTAQDTISFQWTVATTTVTTSFDLFVSNTSGCPTASSTSNIFFCVFAPGTQGTATAALATGSLKVDLLGPPAPTITSITPGDGALNVTWLNGAGSADAGTTGAATNYNIFAVPLDSSASEKLFLKVTGGKMNGRIEGLINDKEYSVTVTALTVGGNESPRSDPATGTPVIILDFWRLYQQANGREQGGCATGAAGLTALLALAPLLWRRRRGGGRS